MKEIKLSDRERIDIRGYLVRLRNEYQNILREDKSNLAQNYYSRKIKDVDIYIKTLS